MQEPRSVLNEERHIALGNRSEDAVHLFPMDWPGLGRSQLQLRVHLCCSLCQHFLLFKAEQYFLYISLTWLFQRQTLLSRPSYFRMCFTSLERMMGTKQEYPQLPASLHLRELLLCTRLYIKVAEGDVLCTAPALLVDTSALIISSPFCIFRLH